MERMSAKSEVCTWQEIDTRPFVRSTEQKIMRTRNRSDQVSRFAFLRTQIRREWQNWHSSDFNMTFSRQECVKRKKGISKRGWECNFDRYFFLKSSQPSLSLKMKAWGRDKNTQKYWKMNCISLIWFFLSVLSKTSIFLAFSREMTNSEGSI